MKNTNKTTKSLASVKQTAAKETSPPAATPSQAQHLAAAILEVLAGLRSPAQAAELLSVSLPRYYQLEARALEGLVAALSPRPKGKQASLESRVRQLEQELEAARRACARQEALVRVTQRSLGLAALVKPPAKTNTKAGAKPDAPAAGRRRKSRRPMVRALRAAQQLRTQADRAERLEHAAPSEPSGQPESRNAAAPGAGNSAPPAVQPIAPHGAGEEPRP